jgi:glycosyltransferase involved in cell wall biosynthesis
MTVASEPDGKASAADDPSPLRVGIVIGSLEAGGAQRMALALAHDLLDADWEVQLFLLNSDREMAVPGDANRQAMLEQRLHVLGGASVRAGTLAKALQFPNLHRRLEREITRHQLDVVVSLMERANLLNLLGSRRCPRIISVRKQITVALADKSVFKRWLVARAYPLLLRRAAAIVLNAHGSAADFARRFAVAPNKLTVIPNSVAPEIATRACASPIGPGANHLGPETIVSVGRLLPAKGHAPLLRAFAHVRESCPEARLVIVGDGPLRETLGELAAALGIGEQVAFIGFQENPYPWMARAGVVALPSRAEGFPNALLEAMYLGQACVAADCPTGPRELLAPDTPVDRIAAEVEITDAGVLVPPMPADDLDAATPLTTGERALAQALSRVLREPELRSRLQAGAADRAAAFTPARARAAWQAVIADSLRQAPGPPVRSVARLL